MIHPRDGLVCCFSVDAAMPPSANNLQLQPPVAFSSCTVPVNELCGVVNVDGFWVDDDESFCHVA